MPAVHDLVCGRCGQARWSAEGVCPECGYDIATAHAPPSLGESDHKSQDAPVSTRRPWLLLLFAGLLAIAVGQLSFGLTTSTDLPAAGVVSTLLGIGLIAGYGALVKSPACEVSSLSAGFPEKGLGAPETKYWYGLHGIADSLRRNELRLAGPLAGVVLLPVLLLRVWGDHGNAWDILLWCASIAAFAAFFIPSRHDITNPNRVGFSILLAGWLRRWPPRFAAAARRRSRDLLPLLAILLIYCAVTMPNLTAWRYSAIGDEYIFYEHAAHMLDEGISRPFSQDGVYGNHPQLNTIYTAAIMRVFGDGHFGWKMTGVVSTALATAGIYVLGYVLGYRSSGILAAGLFASSHYLLGLVNAGYNHTDALPFTVWALAFFVIGLRTRNPLFLYLAGAFVGLGFYFHYSARITGLVMLPTALATIKPRQLLALWPLVFGFLLTAWPTLLISQGEIITRMLAQSVGGYSEAVSGPVARRLADNLTNNLPAFHFNRNSHSYVGGPLLDPVTGALAAVGVGLAVGSANRLASILTLVWIVVAFSATGLISPYPATAITRLFPLVAPLALLAGLAAAVLLDLLPIWVWTNWRRHLPAAVLVVILVGVLALNTHQSWSATHRAYHYTTEALTIGALRHQHCDNAVARTMFVGANPGSTLDSALASYRPESYSHNRLYPEWPPEEPLPEPAPNCVIFVDPASPEARALQAALQTRYPDGELYVFTTPSGKSQVEYFYRSGMEGMR